MKHKELEEVTELRKYREENELSYDSLSKELGIHINSVIRWLRDGTRPSPIMRRLIQTFLKKKGGKR